MTEQAIVFSCEETPLVGIIHHPEVSQKTGVIILVAGGPQYRVGANRQFITLARRLVRQGFPCIRFDHRGMGDSGGEYRGFLDMAADIRAAIDQLVTEFPDLCNIVIWGECESASAAAFYAHKDPRVSSIFLVNPWIRTASGQARTYIKHYYWNRLRDRTFWKKITSRQFSPSSSLKSLYQQYIKAFKTPKKIKEKHSEKDISSLPLPLYLTKSLERFTGSVIILTSGFDYIAQEFLDFVSSSEDWKAAKLDQSIDFINMEEADHTFSRAEWREEMFCHTENWLISKNERC